MLEARQMAIVYTAIAALEDAVRDLSPVFFLSLAARIGGPLVFQKKYGNGLKNDGRMSRK